MDTSTQCECVVVQDCGTLCSGRCYFTSTFGNWQMLTQQVTGLTPTVGIVKCSPRQAVLHKMNTFIRQTTDIE